MSLLIGSSNVFSKVAMDELIDSLRSKGWCVLDDLFSSDLIDSLVTEASQLPRTALQQAGIGRRTDYQVKQDARRDSILWIDANTDLRSRFLGIMEAMRVALNRSLLLGLFYYEAHFARYDKGGFYKKHLDAFKGESNRMLSTVLYLNNDWQTDNGGELVLFDEFDTAKEIAHIRPEKGRFVVFLSESFYHQVNPAKVCRHSIAGWFRINASKHSRVDPVR
ncbi:2OG-Fe(II) oxygenase [Marinomonas sp. 2405UD68-3]|uniref:2OG-Fe(II) oxygenase n=1 Tax=Marinomonas sp. 2405UD68-3 TaxID=3391835 RepID=UPI0039C92DC3